MQEIKCPKCGEVFQVDESGYAAIVKQIRDKEFQKEVLEREVLQHVHKLDNKKLSLEVHLFPYVLQIRGLLCLL